MILVVVVEDMVVVIEVMEDQIVVIYFLIEVMVFFWIVLGQEVMVEGFQLIGCIFQVYILEVSLKIFEFLVKLFFSFQ